MEILETTHNDDQEIRDIVAQYSHDGFFHYLMNNHDELRLMLCQRMVPEARLVSTKVVRNEFYGDFKDSKKVVLDVVAVDEAKRIYNIELQCYSIDKDEIARFQTYGFRIVTMQAKKGRPYDEIQKVRQMIINASNPIKGLNHYLHHFKLRDDNNQEMPHALYEMNLVQLAYLHIEEGADAFDQLMYLFQNNKMCDKIKADKKIEEAIIMHDEYMKSDEMFAAIQRERDRLALKTYKNKARKEGLAQGLATGRAEGLATGRAEGLATGKANERLSNVHKLVKRVYNDEASWLDQCTLEQLDYALDIILDGLDYKEFKERVVNL